MRSPHPRPFGALTIAAALSSAALAWPAAAQAGPSASRPASTESRPAPLEPGIAARCLDTQLSFEALDKMLLARFGAAGEGKAILEQMLQRGVVAALAAQQGIDPSAQDVEAKYQELDAAARSAGVKGGIQEHLQKNRLEPAFFRAMLRLGLQQEALTRRALGLAADVKVTGAQQDQWLEQAMKERGVQLAPPPWTDEVAHSGDVRIAPAEYASALRRELPVGDVREACYQLVLQQRLEARLDERTRAALPEALESSVARRRTEVERNPATQGVSWQQFLQAQGFDEGRFRMDPAVQIEALTRVLVDAANDEQALRAAYEREKEVYEGRYGEAVRTHLMFLSAKTFDKLIAAENKELTPAQRLPRALEQCEQELKRLCTGIASLDDFKKKASLVNEDEELKKSSGDMGYVTRLDPRLKAEMREAIFANAEALGAPATPGRMIGPLRLPGGAAMLWLQERRASPGWDEMRARVHSELRRRLVNEVLPKADFRSFLDAP